MAFAVLVVVAVIVMVLMIVVVAVALPVVVVMLVVMIMVVMVVIVVVAVALDVLLELVVQAGVVDGVVHPVLELVLVHVEDGAHEREVDLLLGIHRAVVLDPVLDVGEVERDSAAVFLDYRGLDVAEEASGLVGDPLADLYEGLGEPGLGVGVEASDCPAKSDGASAGLLDGRGLVVVVMLVFSAHLIIS